MPQFDFSFWKKSGQPEITQITTVAGSALPQGSMGKFKVVMNDWSTLPLASKGIGSIVCVPASDFVAPVLATAYITDFVQPEQSSYFTITDGDGTEYYVWYNVDGGGSDPSPGGTGIEVDISSAFDDDTIGTLTALAMSAYFPDASYNSPNLTFSATTYGGMFQIDTDGPPFYSNSTPQIDASNFGIGDNGTNYIIWFNVDGQGGLPYSYLQTVIEIDVSSGDDENTVASDIASVLVAYFPDASNPTSSSVSFTANNYGNGFVVVDGYPSGTGFDFSGTTDGQDSPSFWFTGPDDATVVVFFLIDGNGNSPGGYPITIPTGSSADDVADIFQTFLTGFDDTNSTVSGAQVNWTWFIQGPGCSIGDGDPNTSGQNTGFALTLVSDGSDPPSISPYFTISDPIAGKYAWVFAVDSVFNPPTIAGATIREVAVSSTDSANTIATELYDGMTSPGGPWLAPAPGANVLTVTNPNSGSVTDAADGTTPTGFGIVVTQQGS